LQLLLLRLERFDAGWQLLELAVLFVRRLSLRLTRLLCRDQCGVCAGTSAAYGCWLCHRFGLAPLPEPVLIATDVLLHSSFTLEDQRARDHVIDKGAIVADEE